MVAKTRTLGLVVSVLAAGSLLLPSVGLAQAPATTVPAPAPVETAPLPPPGAPVTAAPVPAAPATPPATLTQSPPTGSVPPAATEASPAATAGTTLIPQPGDPGDVDEVVLPQKTVLIVSGRSKWDEGLKSLRTAFDRIKAELAKGGVAIAGRPLAIFVETNDDDFRFDAMVPVAAAPAAPATLPEGMRYGTTPSGKAYRFVHKAPYDDIDSTYETITAYLDAKDVAAKDAFIEEYTDDITDPADPNLTINIFVQPQ